MTRPAIKVSGEDDVRRALRAIGADDLREAHAEAAGVVEQRAEQLVPRRSGRLAGSISSAVRGSGGVVEAGGSLPYGAVIHFGWPGHGIEPQPFLYDAADERRDAVIEVYEDRMNQIIKKHGLD